MGLLDFIFGGYGICAPSCSLKEMEKSIEYEAKEQEKQQADKTKDNDNKRI